MKVEYIKIFALLIALFYVNILEINQLRKKNNKPINNIKDEDDYIRYLKGEYDKSSRTYQKDKDSIQNCENSNEDYFSYYISGASFKFDKYVDERDSVNNIICNFICIFK